MHAHPRPHTSSAAARRVASLAVLLVAVVGPAVAHAQEAPPPIRSLGQPPRYQLHASGSGLVAGDGAGDGILVAGVRKPLMNPVTGLAAVELEVYGVTSGPFAGGGARTLLGTPALGLAAGADWHATDSRIDFVLSYRTAVRRGGILGHGTMLRADWLPTRGRTFALGIQVPLFQPLAGETRRRRTTARFPDANRRRAPGAAPVPAASAQALAAVAKAAEGIRIYGNLHREDATRALREAGPWAKVTVAYHRQLGAAFAAAAGSSPEDGGRVAARARSGLLEHVLLPWNRAFGQPKPTRDITRLSEAAHADFARWLRDSSGIAAPAQAGVLAVHARWLGIVGQVHASIATQWRDDRSVWLPLQLALTADDVDEQAEIDSLLARAVERPFTDRNALTLLRSGDLPLEIARSIYAARDYHVLWMHDFAGIREENGALDLIGYEMVADAYLPALTEAVKRYDATGRMPAFMIFLDQFFYEPRDGRLWMTMLEDPMRSSIELPGDEAAREAHLRQRQAELRTAVANSARLRAEAHARGEGWLHELVKVHVNITNPSDFSFRSHRIIPPIPFTPDNIIRDHRKIVFYDLDEADPYGGALYLMGVGVGEHYSSATWEDRGFRVRGPAALEARAAARRMLRRHGFDEDEIPAPLREVVDGATVERRMSDGDYVGRALQVHNEVGFGPKQSSVVRAVLYDVAQPGSIVVVPDPIWVSAEWAGMLAAAAARGAEVHVIAPAKANAPSPQAPLLAMTHEVISRLVELQAVLAQHEGAGALRIGLFAAEAGVDDAAGRRREVREGLARAPWIRTVIPFDDRAIAVLNRAEDVAARSPDASRTAEDVEPRPPQLHQKTQLIARPGAIERLVRQPGWEDALASAFIAQQRQTARFAEQLGAVTPADDEAAMRSSDALLRGYELDLSEAERKRASFHFTLGTQNQDPRGLMLDGEATLVTSGIPASAGLVDLFYLMARTTWVQSQAEIDRLLPPPSGLMRKLGRLIRPAL